MQRGEHQVAGQRGLDRHFGGFQVADLADHDDVGVLPQQRAQAVGESQVDAVLHLHLVEAGSTISIGSSTVQTLTSSRVSRLSVEYSVVVLPEPVGPVTRMMPCGCEVSLSQRSASSSESRVRQGP